MMRKRDGLFSTCLELSDSLPENKAKHFLVFKMSVASQLQGKGKHKYLTKPSECHPFFGVVAVQM